MVTGSFVWISGRVNAITEKDAYPLPCIDKTLDSLAGAHYFSLRLVIGRWKLRSLINKKQLSQLHKGFLSLMLCHLGLLMPLQHFNG